MRGLDSSTRAIAWALSVVFRPYPARTSVGVVLGATLWFLADLFEPSLRSVTYANFAGVPWYGWFAPGLLIMHVPTICSLFRRQPTGDEQLDRLFEMMDRGNFSEAERRRLIRMLIDRVAGSIVLSHQLQNDVHEIERHIAPTDETPASK
jgi:hypothetical protein